MDRPREKIRLVLYVVMISLLGGIVSGVSYYFLHNKLFRRREI